MKVSQILQVKGRDVATIAPDASIAEAIAVLGEKRIGALVVLAKDGSIAGILSERDIVKAMAARGMDLTSVAVRDLMTADVTTCKPDDHVDDVMIEMTQGRFRHIPVIENGRLAGIISIGDAVKARIEELEHERAALQSYIAG